MDNVKIAISQYILTQKIPAGHEIWRSFNASFVNVEYNSSLIASAVYEGRAITTQHANHWRDSKNYLCGQHLGLDFDHGETIDNLLHDPFISMYASFLYTTISHTDAEPRCRVIFLMDSPIMQVKNYTLAASALLWLFHTADRSCKDSVRFFYGAPKCRVEMLNNVLPLDHMKHLIDSYTETGKGEKHKAVQPGYHAPASQQEVADALATIPPWQITYDEWVSVLMAIHSQFGDAGFQLAANWGEGADGEVERKWKSFDASGTVTIATVFGFAKQFGWHKTPQNA